MSTYSIPYYNQMNGNYNNIPQQAAAGQQQAYPQQSTNQSAQQQAQQQVQQVQQQQQPYNYMFYQQQSGVAQQPNQQQQPQGAAAAAAATTGAAQPQVDYSGYSRYSYPANSQANYYQQSIPNQISQPQPQHYNASNRNYTSAPAAPPIPSNSTAGQPQILHQQPTPVQDTLNPANTSTVGQFQPPGIRPRVTTTMWEDEKTLCYQVDANNVSVVRRADNNMINGTKLLNVAQMTRGRRDGILKSEKVRHVVKIGSMHLKGVWIPFERALAMAQREGIVDLLYPLFVRDIKRVIQTGVTPNAAIANNPASAASTTASNTKSNTTTPATSTTSPVNSKATPSQANYYQNYNQLYQYSQYPNQPAASANATASTTSQQPQQQPQQQGGAAAAATTGTANDQYPQQQQMYGYQLSYYPNASNNNQYYPNYYQQQQQPQQPTQQQQPNYASYPYQGQQQLQQQQQQQQQPGSAPGQQSPVQPQQAGIANPSAASPITGNGSTAHQSPQVQSVAGAQQPQSQPQQQQAPVQTSPHQQASQPPQSQGQPNQQAPTQSPVQSNNSGVKEEK